MRPRRVVECIGYLGSITFALVIAAAYIAILMSHSRLVPRLETPFFWSLFVATASPTIAYFSSLSRAIFFVCTACLVFFSDVLCPSFIERALGDWFRSPEWFVVHDSGLNLIIAFFPLAVAVAKHLEIRKLATPPPANSRRAIAVSFLWAGATYGSIILSTSRGVAGVYAQIALLVTLGLCTFHLGLVDINLYKLKRPPAKVGSMKKDADS